MSHSIEANGLISGCAPRGAFKDKTLWQQAAHLLMPMAGGVLAGAGLAAFGALGLGLAGVGAASLASTKRSIDKMAEVDQHREKFVYDEKKKACVKEKTLHSSYRLACLSMALSFAVFVGGFVGSLGLYKQKAAKIDQAFRNNLSVVLAGAKEDATRRKEKDVFWGDHYTINTSVKLKARSADGRLVEYTFTRGEGENPRIQESASFLEKNEDGSAAWRHDVNPKEFLQPLMK